MATIEDLEKARQMLKQLPYEQARKLIQEALSKEFQTVYVVWNGNQFDDSLMCGIFSTEEFAKEYIKNQTYPQVYSIESTILDVETK